MSIQDTKKILICLIFLLEYSGVCNAFVSGVDGDTNFGNVDDRNQLKHQCSHIQEDELKVTGRKLSAIYVRHNLKGLVELRDLNRLDGVIKFTVIKEYPADDLDNIIFQKSLSLDRDGNHLLVVQLNYLEKVKSSDKSDIVFAALILAIIALFAAIFLSIYVALKVSKKSIDGGLFVNTENEEGRNVSLPIPEIILQKSSVDGVHDSEPESRLTAVLDDGCGHSYGQQRSTLFMLSFLAVTTSASVLTICGSGRNVALIIHIPASIYTEEIQIFYNNKFNNVVLFEDWKQFRNNATRIKIYDLPDVTLADLKNVPSLLFNTCWPERSKSSGGILQEDLCYCPRGFYLHQRQCVACRECGEPFYEVSPCLSWQNRVCLHAAYPPSMSSDDRQGKSESDEGLLVESSSNVFLENLNIAKNLETTYYVTDSTQQTDFFWYRDSGIRVNIGLQNITVIPVYEDVSHNSDNSFMLGNPNSLLEMQHFKNILQRHCRHPMPDYYTLTLEISRDRTTEASVEKCTRDMRQKNLCLDQTSTNYEFLRRSLNKPCTVMDSFPDQLKPAANSIVCLESNELLKYLFNITPSVVYSVSFPSEQCQKSKVKCEHCLRTSDCHDESSLGMFPSECCKIDCLASFHCKHASSSECQHAPVECAMGDAYRYTLQPIYLHNDRHFRCHIRQKLPSVLFRLWFYVTVRKTDIETPRIYKTVHGEDVDDVISGHFDFEFISVEYFSGIQLNNEVILNAEVSSSSWNYTIQSIAPNLDTDQFSTAAVHSISSSVFVLSTEFYKPFGYSTSSWLNDNNCSKDVNRFKLYGMKNLQKNDSRPVDVLITTLSTPYEYTIKSMQDAPYIKFSVPANLSLVRWWFKNEPSSLVWNEMFHLDLSLTVDRTFWKISISGHMSRCPGYLSVIMNQHEMDELFKYDMVISCPNNFSLTFYVSNREPLDTFKTFSILLDDAKKTYHVYLTNFRIPYSVGTHNNETRCRMIQDLNHNSFFNFIGFFALGVFIVLILGMLTMRKRSRKRAKTNSNQISDETVKNAQIHRAYNKHKLVLLFLYLFVRIFCSLAITYMYSSSVFLLYLRQEFDETVKAGLGAVAISKHSFEMQQYLASHLEQQTNSLVLSQKSMLQSCSRHVDDSLHAVGRTFEYSGMRNYSSKPNLTSIADLLMKCFHNSTTFHKKATTRFKEDYEKRVHNSTARIINDCRDYLARIAKNPWLLYPASLFSKMTAQSWQEPQQFKELMDRSSSSRAGIEYHFAMFLGISQAENVQLWNNRFWSRYDAGVSMTTLSLEQDNQSRLQIYKRNCENNPCCKHQDHVKSKNTTFDMVDASRYFSSFYIDIDSIMTSVVASGNESKKSSNGFESDLYWSFNQKSISSDINDFEFDSICWDIVNLVLRVMDMFIVVYNVTHLLTNARIFCLSRKQSYFINPTFALIVDSRLELEKLANCNSVSKEAPQKTCLNGDRTLQIKSELFSNAKDDQLNSPVVMYKSKDEFSQKQRKQNLEINFCSKILMFYWQSFHETNVVPKMAIICFTFWIFFCVTMSLQRFFRSDLLLYIIGHIFYVRSTLDQIRLIDDQLNNTLNLFNSHFSIPYKMQILTELHNLQTLVQALNALNQTTFCKRNSTSHDCTQLLSCHLAPLQFQPYNERHNISTNCLKEMKAFASAFDLLCERILDCSMVVVTLLAIVWCMDHLLKYSYQPDESFEQDETDHHPSSHHRPSIANNTHHTNQVINPLQSKQNILNSLSNSKSLLLPASSSRKLASALAAQSNCSPVDIYLTKADLPYTETIV